MPRFRSGFLAAGELTSPDFKGGLWCVCCGMTLTQVRLKHELEGDNSPNIPVRSVCSQTNLCVCVVFVIYVIMKKVKCKTDLQNKTSGLC